MNHNSPWRIVVEVDALQYGETLFSTVFLVIGSEISHPLQLDVNSGSVPFTKHVSNNHPNDGVTIIAQKPRCIPVRLHIKYTRGKKENRWVPF